MATVSTHRNQRLTKNAVVSLLGFTVHAVVTFMMTPILIRGLGDRRYGVWSLVESVLAYLSLFDMGILASVVRNAAQFETRRDWRDLNRVVNTSFALYLVLGTLVLVITVFLAFGWSRPLGAPADLANEVRLLLLLLGTSLAIRLPLGSFAVMLDSIGHYPAKILIRTSWSLLAAMLLALSMMAGYGLATVGIILVCSGLGESLTLSIASCYYVPQLRLSYRYVNRATLRLIFGFSMYSFLVMIAGRISFQTDSLVIGAFLAPQYITFFALGARMVEYSKEPFRTMSMPFMPAISSFDVARNHQAINRLFLDGTRILLWMAIPFQVGFLSLGRGFIDIWVGSGYAAASFPVLAALSATVAISIGQMVAAKVIYGTGNLRLFAIVMVLEAIANLILSALLAQPMGILGVALGTVLPNLVSSFIVIVSVCRMLEILPGAYFCAAWLKPLVLGMALGLFWMLIVSIIPISSWPRFILVGLLGTVPYSFFALWIELGRAGMVSWVKTLGIRLG